MLEAGVQPAVGVTGVQRPRHVAYRAVGRQDGIGVLVMVIANVAVGIRYPGVPVMTEVDWNRARVGIALPPSTTLSKPRWCRRYLRTRC